MNQSIKMHLELSHYSRYGVENVYIYIISYSYYHTKSAVFSPKVSIIVTGLTRHETCGSTRKALFENIMVNTGRVGQEQTGMA